MLSLKPSPPRFWSRRYTYTKSHLVGSEYFDDEAVKARCPALYHQYVGQYMNQRDVARQTAPFNNMSFSSQLLYHMDAQQSRLVWSCWYRMLSELMQTYFQVRFLALFVSPRDTLILTRHSNFQGIHTPRGSFNMLDRSLTITPS